MKSTIQFETYGQKMSENSVVKNLEHRFPNDAYFIEFYSRNNGGSLSEMNLLNWKKIPCIKDDKMECSVSDFLSFKLSGDGIDDSSSIYGRRLLKQKLYSDLAELFSTGFPFAIDMGNNEFWIEYKTGNVFFMPYNESDNPFNDRTKVSESFEEFVVNLVTATEYDEMMS